MAPKIIYIFRKTAVFFSIENIFGLIGREIGSAGQYFTEKAVIPYSGFSLAVLWRNWTFSRKLKGDLFHVTGDVHYITLALPPEKTILTIHDCVFMYQSKGIKRLILQKLLLEWPLKRVRWVTAVSDQTKKDILRFSRCPEEKILVIPNPVNVLITRRPQVFRAIQPVLLFVGTTPNKNLALVAEALEGIPCILEIIGKLPTSMVEKLKEHSIVFRHSFGLTDEEVVEKYAEADMVLFPSTFEGFGMPIIEGQRTGRAVVTSDLSPMKEVAGDGACLVDPYSRESIREGILRVIQNEAYREDLIEKGWENSRRYEIGTVVSKYEELYTKIIEKNRCVE